MASSSSAACVSCQLPLTLQVEHDEEGVESMEEAGEVDDDLQVQCGCHFHWQCMLDSYTLTECPHCHQDLTTISASGEQQILCNLKNEGGLQQGLDILPLLTEETYLKAYPEERKGQAFLEFCREGDLEAIVDLLNDEEDRSGDEIDILRYQDSIRSMDSGLHVAVKMGKPEIAWLLLLLASNLDPLALPHDVISTSESLGLQREAQDGKSDIRTLRDAEEMTAEQRAAATGGMWEEWVRLGRLKPPEKVSYIGRSMC